MTEKMVKVTKAMCINSLLEREDLTEDERKYLTHELELIAKKSSYKSKEDKAKAEENVKLENEILMILNSTEVGLTCSKIAAECTKKLGKDFTPQRITPRLKNLVEQNLIEKYAEKGLGYYRVLE